jgi:type I restriction enzyme S subunit
MSRIAASLAKSFPRNEYYARALGALLSAYAESGLASPHLINEIETGDAGKLWSRVWEAMLYDHLRCLGFQFRHSGVTKSGEHGPDFCIVYQERRIWIEAVTPAPEDIPLTYLEPPKKGVINFRPVLDEEPLLRWISVLRTKRQKLLADKNNAIIGETDCAIIAVNSCRLHDWAPHDKGSSGLPFAVEATFAIGPPAVPITTRGEPDGELTNIPRYNICNPKDSPIRTDNFLNEDYANVGALLGCFHKPMVNPEYRNMGRISLTLVHNPLATNPVPAGILGVKKRKRVFC